MSSNQIFSKRCSQLMTRLLTVLLLTASILSVSGCSKNTDPISQNGFYFDTVISIALYDGKDFTPSHAEDILKESFALCETYENLLSATKEGSDVWNINHANGTPTAVDPQTAELIRESISYCKETEGVLDITIRPIAQLWGFSSRDLEESASKDATDASPHRIPSDAEIRSLLPHVDYHTVSLQGNTVTLADPRAQIDLGFIAKGFIADALKEQLQSKGITDAIINLGGNVLALGSKKNGEPFRVGVKKPFDESGSAIAILPVKDGALVTSGIYERCFQADGKRYHHLLNAKTGQPENNGLYSVSILSSSSTAADGLSTTCYLLGLEKGMELIESLPDTEAVFITEDYELHPTSGLVNVLQTP